MSRLLASIVVLLMLGSCSSGEPGRESGSGLGESPETSSQATSIPGSGWEAPPNYAYVVQSSCGEQNFIGTFGITVVNERVQKTRALDESARAAIKYGGMDGIPTLTELLRWAYEAEDQRADEVEVRYDEADGHPTYIAFDYETDAIDDESCFDITEYEPHGSP